MQREARDTCRERDESDIKQQEIQKENREMQEKNIRGMQKERGTCMNRTQGDTKR